MNTSQRYRDLLRKVAAHLKTFGNTRWPPILEAWLDELDRFKGTPIPRQHLERTRRALGGMGSIGDVVICPEAMRESAFDEIQIRKANEELLRFVRELDREISNLIQAFDQRSTGGSP